MYKEFRHDEYHIVCKHTLACELAYALKLGEIELIESKDFNSRILNQCVYPIK